MNHEGQPPSNGANFISGPYKSPIPARQRAALPLDAVGIPDAADTGTRRRSLVHAPPGPPTPRRRWAPVPEPRPPAPRPPTAAPSTPPGPARSGRRPRPARRRGPPPPPAPGRSTPPATRRPPRPQGGPGSPPRPRRASGTPDAWRPPWAPPRPLPRAIRTRVRSLILGGDSSDGGCRPGPPALITPASGRLLVNGREGPRYVLRGSRRRGRAASTREGGRRGRRRRGPDIGRGMPSQPSGRAGP